MSDWTLPPALADSAIQGQTEMAYHASHYNHQVFLLDAFLGHEIFAKVAGENEPVAFIPYERVKVIRVEGRLELSVYIPGGGEPVSECKGGLRG